jgi:hypothetical protein
MQLTTSSTLALFETTKEQREVFAQQMLNEIKEGNIDPLKVHMQVKSAEHLLDTLKDNPEYKKLLLDAAEKHGKKFETYNAEFQVKEAGTKWDYSNTGDTKLDELQAKYAALGEQIKSRQKFLQTLPASGMADPETGAMIYPATKSSQTIVSCTLK